MNISSQPLYQTLRIRVDCHESELNFHNKIPADVESLLKDIDALISGI